LRIDGDDDLARGAALLDQSYGGGGFGEWVAPVDNGGDVPGLDQLGDLGKGLGGDLGIEWLKRLPGQRAEGRGLAFRPSLEMRTARNLAIPAQ
jgi:hypothetical protein